MYRRCLVLFVVSCFLLCSGFAWQEDDAPLFTAMRGNIQGHTQKDGLFYIGYDMGDEGGKIEVYTREGTHVRTIGPLPIGHVSELSFAEWNGYLYASDGTSYRETTVYEIDISGEPKVLRAIRNKKWGRGGLVSIDNKNKRMLLHSTNGTPGDVTFFTCDMNGNILRQFTMDWLHVPQGLQLVDERIYYYCNTRVDILCARNGCRLGTYRPPYKNESQGLSVDKDGNVYIGYKSPPRIYNIGQLPYDTCPCATAQAGWYKWQGAWYYFDKARSMQKGWQTIKGRSYYFDAVSGVMQTGWHKSGPNWYYLKPSGAMATRWQKVGGRWYYLDKVSGVMQTGWVRNGNAWYYLKPSGAMATRWQEVAGRWYYLKPSGAMQTGWVKSGGKWYYLKSSGSMATGWQNIQGDWYYLGKNGAMATGIKTIDGKKSEFSASGVWKGYR